MWLCNAYVGSNTAAVPAMAAVGEAQRLQDLVRAVGREDLVGTHAVEVRDGGAQLGGGAVGIAMPVDPAQLVRRAAR